jgi:hypothetical protein
MGVLMLAEKRAERGNSSGEGGFDDWRMRHRAFSPDRVARRQAMIDRMRKGGHAGGDV